MTQTSDDFGGVESVLSMFFDGSETFDETTAGIRSVAFTTDGDLYFLGAGGYNSGNAAFNVNSPPDFTFSYFAPLAQFEDSPGIHQLGANTTQHQFLAPSTIEVTDAPALAPVPLPAAA